jgi:hypothetical protein
VVGGVTSSSTWEVPRLALADVDLGDDLDLGVDLAGDLALEVVADELLVGGVEAEAQRQRLELHHRHPRRDPGGGFALRGGGGICLAAKEAGRGGDQGRGERNWARVWAGWIWGGDFRGGDVVAKKASG